MEDQTQKYKVDLGYIERRIDLSTGREAEERMLVFLTGLREDYEILTNKKVTITHQAGSEKTDLREVTNPEQFLELVVQGAKLYLEGKALVFGTGNYQLAGVEQVQRWDEKIDKSCISCLENTPSLANLAPGVNDECHPGSGTFCPDYQAIYQNKQGEPARPLTELIRKVCR